MQTFGDPVLSHLINTKSNDVVVNRNPKVGDWMTSFATELVDTSAASIVDHLLT